MRKVYEERERGNQTTGLEGAEVYSLKTNPATIISNSFISLFLSLVGLFSFQNVIKEIQMFSLADTVTIPFKSTVVISLV